MTSSKPSIPFYLKLSMAFAVFTVLFFMAMSLGAAAISVKDVWLALTSSAVGDQLTIIREIRLPREVGAVVVGAALAVAGAIMQGITRNPLADPGLLGLTAGANAALALTIAILPSTGYYGIMAACFIGAAVGAFMVFGIGAMKRGGFSPFRIVLAGAAVSAFLHAVTEGIGVYFRISKDVSMWTAGGLTGTTWQQLAIITPFIAGALLAALLLSRQLTILSLNEEVAVGLGQNIVRVKLVLNAAIIILAGASVALVGNLAFIGLIIPHLARALVGTDYRYVLPMSAVAGASLMLFADTLARTINAPYETPIIAIVAIMGIPFFMVAVRKGGKAFS